MLILVGVLDGVIRDTQYEDIFYFSIGALILVGVVALLGVEIREFYWNLISRKWPKVNGKVVNSKVSLEARERLGRPRLDFLTTTIVKYKVDGTDYQNRWIISRRNFKYAKNNPFRDSSTYLAGKSFLVYYNPRNPKVATLSPGIKIDSLVKILIIITFTVSMAISAYKYFLG